MIETDFIKDWEIVQWAKSYNSNDELLTELIISQKKDRITEKLAEIFLVISKDLVERYPYSPSYRDDLVQHGTLAALNNWKSFNYKHKNSNAHAFFVQIIKNGHAQCVRKFRRHFRNLAEAPAPDIDIDTIEKGIYENTFEYL